MNLEEALVDLLIKKNYKITTAESCTGGLVASSIVSVENASKVLDVAYVCYANEAKIKYLSVSEAEIKKFGVVSEEVTKQMAIGALKQANADVAIVTSGIAGPGGGSDKKPVGMVCFGIAIKDKVYTYTKQFGAIGRNRVREESVDFALAETLRLLSE